MQVVSPRVLSTIRFLEPHSGQLMAVALAVLLVWPFVLFELLLKRILRLFYSVVDIQRIVNILWMVDTEMILVINVELIQQ
jgi:hypothetical protein